METTPLNEDRCCMARCRRLPVITHLERRLCQFHWEEHCRLEDEADTAAAELVVANDPAAKAGQQEIAMSKKKSKSQPAPTKAQKPAIAAKASKTKVEMPKRVGALSAAAEVLKKAGKPMRAPEMITAMADQKLWTSPGGKTPAATLYAAIIREIHDDGSKARFKKVDRGLFIANA